MDVDSLTRAALEHRRKERREGILLTIIGGGFLATGVLLWMVGNPWMGAIGVAFGGMGILTGIITATGSQSPAARIAGIVACFLFAVTGALSLVAGIVAPGVWGWRGGGSGIIAGALALGFFGPGTVLLIIKERRRRRAR